MTVATMPPEIRSALPALRALPDQLRVNREARRVNGVAILQMGELNDSRPWFIDETGRDQVLSLAKTFTNGLKARWTHPNMSSDGLGKYLGRWRNFRLSDDATTVLADLHLSGTAFRGGEDSRGQWVLNMADEDPEAFGVSLFPEIDLEAMERDEREDGKQPMRFTKLTAADVVDEPAATRGGLFGGQLSVADAPAAATQVLDSLFSDAPREVIETRASAFLQTYLSNRFGGTTKTPEADMATENQVEAPETTPEPDEKYAALSAQVETLSAAVEKLTATPAEPTQEQMTADLSAERTRVNELYALAANAGLQDGAKLAADWVSKGLSVIDAKAQIGELAIKGNKLTSDAGEQEPDEDAAYREEYRAQLSVYKAAGVSEEEYIASRKKDDSQRQF